ncbi:MAG TPA: SufD family Fe-S cluster assembly protein, partial [Gammaproteobacteria bacterium]|nr:SufD family Fe-S cluster assembly protein [Gammaproteobacteria bacterium]
MASKKINSYLQEYTDDPIDHLTKNSGIKWLEELKVKTLIDLKEKAIPSKKDEKWQYTNIEPCIEKSLELFARKNDRKKSKKSNNPLIEKNNDKDIIIYYHNGYFFSQQNLPNYIKTLSTSEEPETFKSLLDRKSSNLISDLNILMLSDVLVIETLKNQKIDDIIHIVICSDNEKNINPRFIFKLQENSSITIFQHQLASHDSVTNGLSDINCGDHSSLELYKIIDENDNGYQIDTQNITLAKNSRLNLFTLDLGAEISRTNINANLVEKNASINIHALFSSRNKLHIDNQIMIKHIAEECRSSMNYRGIMQDNSTGVFGGTVYVDKNAIKTQSDMTNRNLLLSDNARINSKPVLEIYNDDVQCSHSATSGHLDYDKLFYIQSRGVCEK